MVTLIAQPEREASTVYRIDLEFVCPATSSAAGYITASRVARTTGLLIYAP